MSDATGELRVLVVDDDERAVRAWTRALLAARYSVTTASTLREAGSTIRNESFHVVLLDLILTDGNGASLLPRLAELQPPPAVAVISGHLDADRIIELYGSCNLVIPKPISENSIQELVNVLATAKVPKTWVADFCRRHKLSRREAQLLHLAAQGVDNQSAAEQLGCKIGSVKTYWRRIFAKTKCHSQRDVLGAVLRFEVLRRP